MDFSVVVMRGLSSQDGSSRKEFAVTVDDVGYLVYCDYVVGSSGRRGGSVRPLCVHLSHELRKVGCGGCSNRSGSLRISPLCECTSLLSQGRRFYVSSSAVAHKKDGIKLDGMKEGNNTESWEFQKEWMILMTKKKM